MKTFQTPSHTRFLLILLIVLSALMLPAAATAQPTFSKAFSPSTIGPGSVSTLQLTINNTSASPVTNMALTDSLPSGVIIASPARASTDCPSGSLSAPDGGSAISFSGGSVGGSSSCTVSVDVTSSSPGTHANTTGDLTSSAGNSGTASANLTVDSGRPGLSKGFSPATVPFGGRSTLTFTIDNSANASTAFNLAFSDNLPAGMTIASPANTSTTCTGTIVTFGATSGSSTFSFSTNGAPGLAGGASCTVGVDVIGGSVGTLENSSGQLSAVISGPSVTCGKANATLTVTNDQLILNKSFTDDPVAPGGTVTLEFTILNANRSSSATNIGFTDDLDAALSGLTAVSLPSNPCGAGSSLSGTTSLSLANGSLSAEASCTFSATLQVPSGASPGTYTNTTSSISGDIGGRAVSASAASDTLTVSAAPSLTKTFIPSTAGGGDTVTMEFTITNTSSTASAADVAFSDNLSAFMSGATVSSLPAFGFCGGGSVISVATVLGDLTLFVSGGSLAASDSCTFQVDLDLPVATSPGPYVNTTGTIIGTVGGSSATGDAASDTLTIVGAPTLVKEFIDDPVTAGDSVTLQFTILNDQEGAGSATGITFTDDLNAVVPGLTATVLPATGFCGASSTISGTTTLTVANASLAAGDSCTFNVTLAVPGTALPGAHPNTTSNLMATVDGVSVQAEPAVDDLDIAGLTFSKSFTDDPVIAGSTVTLEFTIENLSPTASVTDIAFSDSLSSTLSGLSVTGALPSTPCGASSVVSGTTNLSFSGGSLAPSTSCTFSVTLQVPAAAADGTYANLTSSLQASVDGSSVVIAPASDGLVVASDFIFLDKEFTDDPVSPGEMVTLQFTITNTHPTATATNLSFTDDLDGALTGLASVSGTVNDVCGSGSSISGAGFLTFSGGAVAPGSSCTFGVILAVPSGTELGSVVTNTTSDLSGTIDGSGASGAAASDDLQIFYLSLSKSFDGPANAGDTVTLTFTLENLSGDTVDDLGFTDDLDAVLSGLVASNLPEAPCGESSEISGTSFLVFSGGSLLPGGSCSFMVDVVIPAGAEPGSYLNVTSELFQIEAPTGNPATATLVVLEPVGSECPDPTTIDYGGYTAASCAAPQTAVTVFNQAELDAYMLDFGFDGSKVRNVKVNFNPSGDVVIVSPCEVHLNGEGNFLDIQADKLCVYGRKGVTVAQDQGNPDEGVTASHILLVSEEGSAGFSKGLTLTADEITVVAEKEAKIGLASTVSVSGSLNLISVGDLTTSDAIIRKNTLVSAGDVLVEASRAATLGDLTILDVAGGLIVRSTGSATGSVASVSQGAQVEAGNMELTSGNKAVLGDDTVVIVDGLFVMDAGNTCLIHATAFYSAATTSGNCL